MFLVTYLSQHWHGRHSITHSFWVNLILPVISVLAIQSVAINPLIRSGQLDALFATVVLSAIYILLMSWQFIGLIRAVNIQMQSGSGSVDSWVIYAAIFGLTILVIIRLIDTLSSGIAEQMSLEKARGKPFDDSIIGLSITISENKRVATINGTLNVGATRLVTETLDLQSLVDTVVLDSNGGSIYEGRGIGKLVQERSVSTHVVGQCLSACTLAFAGGLTRTAKSTAVFGFHAYRVDAIYAAAWLDVNAQQQQDIDWFEQQGVASWFTQKVYLSSSSEMWTPTHDELTDAGFLTN